MRQHPVLLTQRSFIKSDMRRYSLMRTHPRCRAQFAPIRYSLSVDAYGSYNVLRLGNSEPFTFVREGVSEFHYPRALHFPLEIGTFVWGRRIAVRLFLWSA